MSSQVRGSSLDGYDVEAARGAKGSSLDRPADDDDVEVVIIKKKIVRTTLPDGSVITTTEPATGSAPNNSSSKSSDTAAATVKKGGSSPLMNIGFYVFFPFILVWYSISKFLLPCLSEYFNTFLNCCCFELLTGICGCCCGDMRFTDSNFKAGPKSIGGEWENDMDVDWIRCGDLISTDGVIKTRDDSEKKTKGRAHLFENGIQPSDIAQGQLGDCWLLSAIATLAEKKGQIEQVFRERSFSYWGKYHMRLYNAKADKWETVVIDDYVPCKNKKPMFTKPKGNEMWVLLLEKAFAKYVGDYADLEGGMTLWAMEAMTGDIVSHFEVIQDKWQKMKLVHLENKENKRKCALEDVEGETHSSDDFFDILAKYEKVDAAMAAYSKGTSDKESTHGIVEGHAYSILNVKEVKGKKFLQLRNPWGTFSWDGAWSDSSELWEKNPDIAKALNFKIKSKDDKKDDGVFWMLFEDFMLHFDAVDVLDREVNMKDVVFTMEENHGVCCGPFIGCMKGCFRYWCCCVGISHLCCPHKSKVQTV